MASGSTQACGLTVLRITVGAVFLDHGYQKLFHFGFHGVAGMFGHMGIPLPMVSAVVVTLVEFVGGILLIAGLGTRVAAALLAIEMTVAILAVHLKHGFGAQNGGFEYPLTLLAACLCLVLSGGGMLSLRK
jgi:putative oxidoreductase